MTKVENVNRVTIRQKDNYILIVKNPEVFTSSQTENTYINYLSGHRRDITGEVNSLR